MLSTLLVARLAEMVEQAKSAEVSMQLAEALFRATGRIANTLRTHSVLSTETVDEIDGALGKVLSQLNGVTGGQR